MRAPYRTTPVFDQDTLPAALRREHRTRAGAWGVIRVLEGQLRLSFADGEPEQLLTTDNPGRIAPEQTHWVEPIGPMQMCVEFYDSDPGIAQANEEAGLPLSRE